MDICNWLGFVILKNVVIDHYHYFCSSGYDIFRFAAMFSSVQLLSHVQLFVAPWTTARQASLSITNSWSSPKPMSIKSVMPSNQFILSCPLLLLPSTFPSIRIFSNDIVLPIRWPEVLELQHQSFQWIFRSDFLEDRLVGSPCCPRDSQESSPALQFESISCPIWTFVGKVMSLHFNTLSTSIYIPSVLDFLHI